MLRSRLRPFDPPSGVLPLLLCAACASGTSAPPAADVAGDSVEAAAGGLFVGSEGQSRFADCYEPARAARPDVSVHTPMLFFGRGGKIVFGYLELSAQDRVLERCLRQKVVGWELPGPTGAPENISSGGMLVRLGPVAGPPSGPHTRDEVIALRKRAIEAAIGEGVFAAEDPELRKLREDRSRALRILP